MATQQTLTRTAPRIKLVIADEEKYKEHLYWLGCVANDLRNLRNDVMRECVSYLQKQIDGEPLPVNEKGKTIDYRTYAGQRRKKYDFANGTLCNWTEFLTVKTFKQYKKQILAGKANIPMFKDKSIPVYGKGSRLWVENGEFFLKPPAMNGIVFKFVNPEKNKSLAAILERVLSGEYSFDFSKIIKDDKFWYLHLSYTFEKVPDPNLDPAVVCGIDLGWVVPAYCGLNEGPQRQDLGDSQLIRHFRSQIRSRRRNLHRRREGMKSGHGKERALKALNHFSQRERDFMRTVNHGISRQIIDFCVRNRAGTIHMEALTADVKKNAFLTAYWTYYQLQQMVEYKAAEHGIVVCYINPKNTSRMCSACGHVDAANRPTQKDFRCLQCGHEAFADYNASVNIARSSAFVKTGELIEEEEEEEAG